MNVNDLIGADAVLLGNLDELGLSREQQDALGLLVGARLDGVVRSDRAELLSGLTADAFLAALDVNELAERLGIDTAIVQAALALLATSIVGVTDSAH